MCYLVAKDRDAHGCFALKTTHGKHLVELKKGTEPGGWVSGRMNIMGHFAAVNRS